MSTFNADVAKLTDEQMAAITIPEFDRMFVKVQPAGERKFSASGAKADAIIRYLLTGGYSRDQIAFFTGASPSRVGEVMWAMDAAGVTYAPLARKTRAKADELVADEPTVEPTAKPHRGRKATAKASA